MAARTALKPSPTESERPYIPWRDRAFVNIDVAAEAIGVSAASVYRLAAQGTLVLRRVAGRVVVETAGLLAVERSAEKWAPSERGAEARKKRAELARTRWQS